MNVFLIEKKSSLNKHRVNLALARISTLHKQEGDNVYHYVLNSKFKMPTNIRPDKVYISIVFSWDVPKFVKFVNALKNIYKLKNENIIIGGVCTLYMKDQIIKWTGIVPQVGCSKNLDIIIPDKDLYEDDTTYLFTMRSCPNKCSFCIVNDLEPKSYVIENWKEQINLNAKYITICDNNLLAGPYEHRKAVFDYLSEIANIKGTRIPGTRRLREVILDGGFDFRYLTEENLELMKNIKFAKIKIAFDDIKYEKKFDEGMQLLLKYFPKVSKRGIHEKIECYILYNCPFTKDTIKDTLYRIYKLKYYYRVNPYVMRFQPLDTLKYKSYVSPYWSERDCVDIGRWANNRYVFMKVKQFKDYLGRKKDGKCISKTTNILKMTLKRVVKEDSLPYDFTKGYEYNIPLINQEFEEREKSTKKFYKEYEQLSLMDMIV